MVIKKKSLIDAMYDKGNVHMGVVTTASRRSDMIEHLNKGIIDSIRKTVSERLEESSYVGVLEAHQKHIDKLRIDRIKNMSITGERLDNFPKDIPESLLVSGLDINVIGEDNSITKYPETHGVAIMALCAIAANESSLKQFEETGFTIVYVRTHLTDTTPKQVEYVTLCIGVSSPVNSWQSVSPFNIV